MSEPINLSLLPAPDLVEPLDFETIRAAHLADLQTRFPDLDFALESDPVVKLIEAHAYRELLLRARVNDAARGNLLAFATGADLDQLGAWWGITRRELIPADPDALPPTAAVMEGDASFRLQIQASPEAITTAGSRGAYRWHAMAADPTLLDVGVSTPMPGTVLLSLLGADGTVTAEQLDVVLAALSAEDVRPLCDRVQVLAATTAVYPITAILHLFSGPAPDVVIAAATAAVTAYTQANRLVGARVALSAVLAALHQPGVDWVELITPTADLLPAAGVAPWPGVLTLTAVQDGGT